MQLGYMIVEYSRKSCDCEKSVHRPCNNCINRVGIQWETPLSSSLSIFINWVETHPNSYLNTTSLQVYDPRAAENHKKQNIID